MADVAVAEPVSRDLIAIPFHKSTICVLPRKAIIDHIPRTLLEDGFRLGKRIKRARALRKRMKPDE